MRLLTRYSFLSDVGLCRLRDILKAVYVMELVIRSGALNQNKYGSGLPQTVLLRNSGLRVEMRGLTPLSKKLRQNPSTMIANLGSSKKR